MFDAVKAKSKCVDWIRDWFKQNGDGCSAVIGISGGKDSTVVAALCVEAIGRDRVIGVAMPNGYQQDIKDSYDVARCLGIRLIEANIKDAVDSILKNIDDPYSAMFSTNKKFKTQRIKISDQTRVNLPARVRMATLYAVSQSYNGRVANTCNLSEDYIGYSTRYGDGAGDFAPLGSFTSDEVVAIGDLYKELPSRLVHKTPSDGLCGMTDEDNFGFTYAVLNRYIKEDICEDDSIREKIDQLHSKNRFKLLPIPFFDWKG